MVVKDGMKNERIKELQMQKFGVSPSSLLFLCLAGLSFSQLLQASVKQPEFFFLFSLTEAVACSRPRLHQSMFAVYIQPPCDEK